MRFLFASSALIALAAAQSLTFDIPSQSLNLEPTPVQSSVGEIDATVTESVSGPIQTGQACATIARFATRSNLRYPSVEAALALACLQSVPIFKNDASKTIDSIKQMVEFQSTISYLKDPPQGWPNDPVDIMGGLDDIKAKVNNGEYTNEYDFENDIASLFVKAHDGHLNFNGMAYSGAFRWRRSSAIALISASKDGSEMPKVWAIADFNTTNTSYKPSPVKSIEGKDAVQFLQDEAKMNAYHDPDTRYNAMFFMQPAENYGYWANPRFYPGATSTITFENGTSNTYKNAAIILQASAWKYITDPESFYETYILPETSSSRVKKRDPNALPQHLENPRDHEFRGSFSLQHGSVPLYYPKPSVAHSAPMVPLAGYFVTTSVGQIGILVVQTFNTEDATGAIEFQSVTQQFIALAKARNVAKIVIDLRTNGGGKVLSGYDMYLQFFPSQKPQTQSRYRGHPASDLFGKSISSYTEVTTRNAELFTSPFSNDAFLNKDLQKFAGWADMYPPETFHGDNYTTLLKYNLSDPLTTSNTKLAVGITITGYGKRNNFTEDPFKAEDIMILSDGICASTCSIFVELMAQQSKVRTLTVGGRPQLGPMVPVGGTKGTLVLPSTYLQTLSGFIVQNFAMSRSQVQQWAAFVPNPFYIGISDASVNFQDNIRAGLEKDGIPTQFLNDTSSCRIWYEPDMLLNVTKLWEKTAKVAWGKDGALDSGACVRGSVSSREQQEGQGQGNPGTGNGTDAKKSTAGGRVRAGWGGVVVCAVVVMGGMVLI